MMRHGGITACLLSEHSSCTQMDAVVLCRVCECWHVNVKTNVLSDNCSLCALNFNCWIVNTSAERISQNQMAVYLKWKSGVSRNSKLYLENLTGHLGEGVCVKIINTQNQLWVRPFWKISTGNSYGGSRNCMFAVLELTLSCPVVVVRLLEYDMVRVVAFFFFLCCVLLWNLC